MAQVTLNADGLGNTYALITSVLAPGSNSIETPDDERCINFEKLASLSIHDALGIPNRLSIFPNHARDELMLTIIPINATSLLVYTVDGRLVLQEQLDRFRSLTLNTTNLTNGTFLVKVSGLINNAKELLIIDK